MTKRAAFFCLYDEAMAQIRTYIDGLESQEAEWFLKVHYGFEEELRSWDLKPFLAEYLRRAEACRFRGLGVMAYIYLHVNYDLPRVCAQGLRSRHSLSLDRCACMFADSSSYIASATASVMSQSAVLGIFGPLLNAIPGGVSMAGQIAQWVLAHRCAAWQVAERLALMEDSSGEEQELWKRVESGCERVFRSPDPFRWLKSLPLM